MARVELYTKVFCGFCVRAKHLLETKGVGFDEYSVDGGGPKRDEMVERSGGRMTVPQIFIDGVHIGGCDELFELEKRGELDARLNAA